MSTDTASICQVRRLPCAVLRLWQGESADAVESLPEAVLEHLAQPGVYPIGAGLVAIAPTAGDEAIFDAALASSELLRREPLWPGEPRQVRGLVFPGVVRIEADGTASLEPEALLEDLQKKGPDLAPGTFLTGRVVQTLEYPVETHLSKPYLSPSGKKLPLIECTGARFDLPPWRNREFLGQRTQWMERPVPALLSAGLEEPILRVSGPLGVGKTRLLWHELDQRQASKLWLTARPARTKTPILAEQVLRQLLLPTAEQEADARHPDLAGTVDRDQIHQALNNRRNPGSAKESDLFNERAIMALDHLGKGTANPVWIVVDDVRELAEHDLEFLARLLALGSFGDQLRLVGIGRGLTQWPEGLADAPAAKVAAWGTEELSRLAAHLTRGFSLPESMLNRFVEVGGGNPLVVEEALFSLVHDKTLRHVYGSYFFAGDENRPYSPSNRLVRHIHSEVARLGDPFPVRLMSVIDGAAPAEELAAASSLLGAQAEFGWEVPLVEAGLIKEADSPWGPGLEPASPAITQSLAFTLDPDSEQTIRHQVGELLAERSRTGEGHWFSYRLLAGSENAVEPLLRLFKTGFASEVPGEELLEALTTELAAHRERDGDPDVELQLLWRLLPLARRLGSLRNFQDDLARSVALGTASPRQLLALASIKAELEQESGQHQEAENTLKKALEGAADTEPRRKALLLIQLGRLFLRQGRSPEARQLFGSVLQAVGESEPNPLTATCRYYLGNIDLHDGAFETAYDQHLKALEVRESQQLSRPIGSSLSALGAVAIGMGNYPKALEHYQKAEEILRDHGKEGEAAYALLGMAKALDRLGDYTSATGPVRRALAMREGRDNSVGEAIARLAVAKNYLDIGQPDNALEQARQAHFELTMASTDDILADAEALIGRIHLSQRHYEAAKSRFETALEKHLAKADQKAGAFDLAHLLEIALALKQTGDVRKHTTEMKTRVAELPPSDLGDILAYRLYLGLEYLTREGLKVGDPQSHLERAYHGILKKAEHLSHEQRQRFLFQIPDHQAVLAAATERGLTTPV